MKDIVQRILEKSLVDAIILSSGPNLRYLLGKSVETFERPFLLAATKNYSVLIAPRMEKDRLSDVPVDNSIFYTDEEDPFLLLHKSMREYMDENAKIGLDPNIRFWLFKKLQMVFPHNKFTDIGELLLEMRSVKKEDELRNIQKAIKIIEHIYRKLEDIIEPGITEIDLSYEMMKYGEKLGAEKVVFSAVQSGPNSSIPHHERSDRKITLGDVIVVDIALSYNGYYGDLTRVFVLGAPPAGFNEKYNVVKGAVERGVKSIVPGVRAGLIDNVVRSFINEKGYGKYFIHRTGHGLGLEVHEKPFISSLSRDLILPNMVFTVEPGIYFSGKYGIRLETDVVVTSDGSRSLDSFTWDPVFL